MITGKKSPSRGRGVLRPLFPPGSGDRVQSNTAVALYKGRRIRRPRKRRQESKTGEACPARTEVDQLPRQARLSGAAARKQNEKSGCQSEKNREQDLAHRLSTSPGFFGAVKRYAGTRRPGPPRVAERKEENGNPAINWLQLYIQYRTFAYLLERITLAEKRKPPPRREAAPFIPVQIFPGRPPAETGLIQNAPAWRSASPGP